MEPKQKKAEFTYTKAPAQEARKTPVMPGRNVY